MIGKMGGKPQQRKWGTQKMKKRRIRVMENQMRMRNRGMIRTMAHRDMPGPSTTEVQRQVPNNRVKTKG
jgi:hypothetical protein